MSIKIYQVMPFAYKVITREAARIKQLSNKKKILLYKCEHCHGQTEKKIRCLLKKLKAVTDALVIAQARFDRQYVVLSKDNSKQLSIAKIGKAMRERLLQKH